MKIFISWSGHRSRAVAELLSDWIKCVLQATQPWVSTRDIDRGALWFSEIGDQLRDTTVGIICLTQENKERPWILFEAGALAKGLSTSRVCTFLIDLKSSDLQDPLAQFNHTWPTKPSMWELLRTLNGCLESSKLDERILAQVFETYWPQFETKFEKVLEANPPGEKIEPRSEESILAEILQNTRSLSSRVNSLETASRQSTDSKGFSFKRSPPVVIPFNQRKFQQCLSPDAQEWGAGARLIEVLDGSGRALLQVRSQDEPSQEIIEELQTAAWNAIGTHVSVVFVGVPSQ